MNLFHELCGHLLEVGSLAKGSWMLEWSGVMGAGWAGMVGDSTKSVFPVQLVNGYG